MSLSCPVFFLLINPLAHGRYSCKLKFIIFKLCFSRCSFVKKQYTHNQRKHFTSSDKHLYYVSIDSLIHIFINLFLHLFQILMHNHITQAYDCLKCNCDLEEIKVKIQSYKSGGFYCGDHHEVMWSLLLKFLWWWIQGLCSLRRCRLTGIGIPMINLRRSDDRLRFIMGIPILVRRRLLSE